MFKANVSMNPRKLNQKTLQLADLVCARSETNVVTGSGTVVATLRSPWTGARRCLHHPSHLEMTIRCKLKNRDRTKQQRNNPNKTKDSGVTDCDG